MGVVNSELTPRQLQIWAKTQSIKGAELSVRDRAYLVARVAADIGRVDEFADLGLTSDRRIPDYFEEGAEGFDDTGLQAFDLFERLVAIEAPAETYFDCLSRMELRRRKYQMILETQPVPTMDQVGPRALLQYGRVPAEVLASFLVWRKWIYDIDNRSAQETGYLFEPIVREALGGVAVSAKESPVRRGGTGAGRQIDCLRVDKEGKRLAYELKMRVTVAASGQGRFQEELSFAQDAESSGVTPVLVVFDPTAANKLTELKEKFASHGGHSYVGDEAWEHLEGEAVAPLDLFLERYVRQPLDAVFRAGLDIDGAGALSDLSLKLSGGRFEFTVSGHDAISIQRLETVEPPPEPDEQEEE